MINEEWNNRPPTHDSFPIYGEKQVSEGNCESFYNDYDSEYSADKDPLNDRINELAHLNYNKVAKNQDKYTQFLNLNGKKNRSPVLGYLQKLSGQPVNPRQNGFNFKSSRAEIDLNC